jgi:ubiquinone/menaquinone biosynthesis C-methylase UbiE/DNA-binding HxlR family transcriptional regulator
MASFLKALKVLGDEGRVRLLRLLAREELSVAELQDILGMGQSRISMQLSQLKQAGFVDVRRAGQKSLYRLTPPPELQPLVQETLSRAALEIRATPQDDEALRLVLEKRKDNLRNYFDELAGRFGRNYVPGRGWKALTETLLRLLPRLRIADLGAGEATVSLMLAQHAERVIAIDNSLKMVEYGRAVAEKHGVGNLDYRLGDLEDLPAETSEVDVALFHQSLHHAIHPDRAVMEAFRVLRPGGTVIVVDLLKHGFDQARELYGDVWLGFSHVELTALLRNARFESITVDTVQREDEAPHFETVLASGVKNAQHDPASQTQ